MVQKLSQASRGKLVVGVTGGFGCGKSTAVQFFREWGAHTVDADELSREALEITSPIYHRVKSLFKEAVEKDGSFNRKKIALQIFKDEKQRRALEELVHPYVFERVAEEIGAHEAQIIAVEVPLLFETGFDQYCDYTLTVFTEPEQIAKRLQEKGFSQKEIAAREKAQLPVETKKKKASFVLDNSTSLDQTRKAAEKIWRSLLSALKGE